MEFAKAPRACHRLRTHIEPWCWSTASLIIALAACGLPHDAAGTLDHVRGREADRGAPIIGILLVAFGRWWGDAVAAAFISVEIVHDGWMNMRLVVGDLMDEAPTRMGSHALEDITEKVRHSVRMLDDVEDAGVRMREHGRVLTGEVFVAPAEGGDVVSLVRDVAERARSVDWRIHDVTVMPVVRLESRSPPRASL